MSVSLIAAVALGGFIGAPSRLLLDRFISSRIETDFPWGTFVINISGSFALGLITGLAMHIKIDPVVRALLGVGFCGAYTTFSTFTYESVGLIQAGQLFKASLNIVGSALIGLAGAAAGIAIGMVI